MSLRLHNCKSPAITTKTHRKSRGVEFSRTPTPPAPARLTKGPSCNVENSSILRRQDLLASWFLPSQRVTKEKSSFEDASGKQCMACHANFLEAFDWIGNGCSDLILTPKESNSAADRVSGGREGVVHRRSSPVQANNGDNAARP